MNMEVGSMAILVNDAKKSAEWYHDKLDFKIVGDKGHSVFVRPKSTSTPLLHLCGKRGAWETDRPGGRVGVWLECRKISIKKDEKSGLTIPASNPEDVENIPGIEEERRGVLRRVDDHPVGKYAILKDPDGNEFEIL
jgi:catechol 2,3-dioxygenase-like lactoylglutathione lyase family enzyme